MSQKKNLTRVNLYDKEFPSLSGDVDDTLGASSYSSSYSSRLKTVLQYKVPKQKESYAAVNKKPDIPTTSASKIRNEKTESDKLSTKQKRKPYESPSRTFDSKTSFSKNSASYDPVAGDCSEIKSDVSSAWTVVKKKRVNQENNRQSKNEFCAAFNETHSDNKNQFSSNNSASHINNRQNKNKLSARNLSIKETLNDNEDQFRSKNGASPGNYRQNKNLFNNKNSFPKNALKGNNDLFRFKNDFSDKHSVRSKSSFMKYKPNNLIQHKCKADFQNNINSENFLAQSSAHKISHQRNVSSETLETGSPENRYRNNESEKNVPESFQRGSSFKQLSSTLLGACTNDKLLDNPARLKKCDPKFAPKNTDPGHFKSNLKSCHNRPYNVPKNHQIPNCSNSTLANAQKISDKPESVLQNESIGVRLDKTTKRKRKSKLKRQAGLQRDKVQLISHNVFDKILKLSCESNTQTQKNVTLDINNASEYPELGAKADCGKRCFYSEVVCADKEVEVKNEETNIITSGSPNKGSLFPAGDDKNKSPSDVEEGTPETEKLALRHNDPITVSLFDIITNKTKKKHPDRNSKFLFGVPTSTAKGKKSSFLPAKNQTVNPLDSSKPAVKRGKEREKPKLKKPSHLKKIILLDRMKRKEQIRSNKGELSGPENVDDLITSDGDAPALTSPSENDQIEGYSHDLAKGSMIAEGDASSIENYYFDSKKHALLSESDVSCNENLSCDSKNSAFLAECGDSPLQIGCDQKCLTPFQKDSEFLQNETCDSNNQLDQSDSSFIEIIVDVKWLFGYNGQCFHKVPQTECLTCADLHSFNGGVLPSKNQRSVPRRGKVLKFPRYDTFLYSIRYMFAVNSSSKITATEPDLSDVKYLFMKESCSSVLEDDEVSVITSSDCECNENSLSPVISDRLEMVNHNSSAVIDDKNITDDKIKIDDENLSIIVVDNLALSGKMNNFTCDTNLNMSYFSSDENEMLFIENVENKINIYQMKNEIPVIKEPVSKSVANNTSDCSENVIQSLPDRKFSESVIKQASRIVLHSKKFREYCDQFLSKNLDETVSLLLDDLARFQDRMHQKDPVKARMKRRLVYGIREIKRHVKLKKLKCIIIASDIEDSQSEGGLNDNLEELKSLARDFQIPYVFSHTRRQLGKRCRKSAPVSAAGIFNYDGSEENFKKMLILQRDCKLDYVAAIKSLSSMLTDSHVKLLCQTKEDNPSNLSSVNTKLLKEFYPPVKLIDEAPKSCEDDMLSGSESNNCKDEKVTMYNILVKYKIINY